MLKDNDLLRIVNNIQHDEYDFLLKYDESRPYLQICCNSKCNVTGEPMSWTGRKWLLSYHMTSGEIVQTALKAALTAAEHECREKFTYRGITLFDPHQDLDKMVDLRLAAGLKERDLVS